MEEKKISLGRKYEQRFFGKGAVFDEKVLQVFIGDSRFPNFHDALRKAMHSERQRQLEWNPKIPSTTISGRLFKEVQKHLTAHEIKKLRLYCTIGCSCDFYHGVDGFFELKGGFCTFDITLKADSEARPEVDLIIRDRPNLFIFFRGIAPIIARTLRERGGILRQ